MTLQNLLTSLGLNIASSTISILKKHEQLKVIKIYLDRNVDVKKLKNKIDYRELQGIIKFIQ